jgi:hypothetical protein
MGEAPRSNRPTPRTAAAIEAELKRRIRAELSQARQDADGELDDAALAAIIARAVAAALSWHLDAPEHTRNATVSSRSWRSAGGPRAGGPRREPNEERSFEERPYEERGPRDFRERPPRGPYQQREFEDRDYPQRRGPQQRPPFGPRGGRPPGRGGGFGPRRPPRGR